MLPRGLFNLLKLQSAKAIPTTRGITTTPANKGLENILKSIPKESAQKTQSESTVPTYNKVKKEFLPEGKRLDYGAGRGLGAKEIKADTFEPFPRKGFKPTFKNTDDIPSSSYENISSLNVLNVLQQNDRKKAVKEIGRILKPGGRLIYYSFDIPNHNNLTLENLYLKKNERQPYYRILSVSFKHQTDLNSFIEEKKDEV